MHCLCVQLMWAVISVVGMLFMQPTDPNKTNPRTVVQLQQFSWTEGALEESIKVPGCRIRKMPGFCSQQ